MLLPTHDVFKTEITYNFVFKTGFYIDKEMLTYRQISLNRIKSLFYKQDVKVNEAFDLNIASDISLKAICTGVEA